MQTEMQRMESERLQIVDAKDEDIDQIIEIESDPENRDFLWIGTPEEHRDEIRDPHHLLLLFKTKETGKVVGYSLIRLDFKSNIFEIRRIAIVEKGNGYGKESMKRLIRYAFEETDTNRLWLDVYPDNPVGIHLYESLGMHRDGVLRQNYLAERGYLDQIIYSILRSEYPDWKKSTGI
ncbi:MAG: GNAT family N-acetyltransferase [Anaerovoracaceae bacterium]|jgi:ribosomal-protein-alanine N-acetyltransferase